MRGTISPHGDGKWRIWVYVGKDPVTGKDKKVSRVVEGKRGEAEDALAALITEVRGGGHRGTNARTFGEAVDKFMELKSIELEATSLALYNNALKYIPDHLLGMPVTKVGSEHIEALYVHLRSRGSMGRRTKAGLVGAGQPLSESMVDSVATVIRGALAYALRHKWVGRNVAADVTVPSGPGPDLAPVPSEAVGQLLAKANRYHPKFRPYVRVSICLGGRRSEVHGLRWSGVDFERGRIHIKDVIVKAERSWIVKPRTKTSRKGTVVQGRTVTLDTGTVDALRTLHAEAMDTALLCGTTLHRDAFVFSDDPTGETFWNPQTTARWFKRLCADVGIDDRARLHDLRHLMATYAIDEGAPIPAVSGRAGHASNAITLDLYAGRVPKSDQIVADLMGRLLDGT